MSKVFWILSVNAMYVKLIVMKHYNKKKIPLTIVSLQYEHPNNKSGLDVARSI